MKRSEMLKIIEAAIENAPNVNTWPANYILMEIERLGMLPPTIEILSDCYNRSEGRMGFDSNEWEPEDET